MNLFYSWISDDDKPDLVKKCIKSWENYILPLGFDLINLNYDYIKSNQIKSPYLDRVLNDKLYAHASDYLRFHSMYHYGGLYLDSDVECVGDIHDLIELDTYIGREGEKSSIPDEPEAAILWFKDPMNLSLNKLLNAYDHLDLSKMTYKEIKLNTSPRMMLKNGLKVTSISHPNLIHRFNNTWFDYDVFVIDDIGISFSSKWNIVDKLTRNTRYVISKKPMDFGEYKNLNLVDFKLEDIQKRFL